MQGGCTFVCIAVRLVTTYVLVLLLRCDAASLRLWFPTFRRVFNAVIFRVKQSKKKYFVLKSVHDGVLRCGTLERWLVYGSLFPNKFVPCTTRFVLNTAAVFCSIRGAAVASHILPSPLFHTVSLCQMNRQIAVRVGPSAVLLDL